MEMIHDIKNMNKGYTITHKFSNGEKVTFCIDEIDGKKVIRLSRFDYHIRPVDTDIIYL